jgi:hypothetical protein
MSNKLYSSSAIAGEPAIRILSSPMDHGWRKGNDLGFSSFTLHESNELFSASLNAYVRNKALHCLC